MQILVNLSSNRAITLHLLTIGLYTLNVCPMKSLFKRRNCRVIDDRNTADWITDWLGLYILKDLLWIGYQSLRTYEYVLHDTKPFLLAKTNSYFHKNTKLAFFSTGWIVHCWFSLYKYWVVIKLPVSVSVSLNRSLNKFNKYEKKKKNRFNTRKALWQFARSKNLPTFSSLGNSSREFLTVCLFRFRTAKN